MHFLDHHYSGRFGNEFLTEQGFAPMKATEAPPSYYIRRQVACTFMDDPVAVACRQITGFETIMWSSDYPHPVSSWPNSRAIVEKMFHDVGPEERQLVVSGNAARVWNL